MGDRTGIQWTDASWNPWMGCTKVSPGCAHCYMFREQKQYGNDPEVVRRSKTKFSDPLKWKEPRKIFTCSWSDWFHEDADAWRDEAWEIIWKTPQHTYQILTKRPERIADHLPWTNVTDRYPNVWLGVSVENQRHAYRADLLAKVPAAVRFISAEPLLGPVTFERSTLEAMDWLIVGGESGPGARSMDLAWARSIVQQCQSAGVAPFVKQLGTCPVCANDDARHWPHESMPLRWDYEPHHQGEVAPLHLNDRKGGDMAEWPEDLRVREFPTVAVTA